MDLGAAVGRAQAGGRAGRRGGPAAGRTRRSYAAKGSTASAARSTTSANVGRACGTTASASISTFHRGSRSAETRDHQWRRGGCRRRPPRARRRPRRRRRCRPGTSGSGPRRASAPALARAVSMIVKQRRAWALTSSGHEPSGNTGVVRRPGSLDDRRGPHGEKPMVARGRPGGDVPRRAGHHAACRGGVRSAVTAPRCGENAAQDHGPQVTTSRRPRPVCERAPR